VAGAFRTEILWFPVEDPASLAEQTTTNQLCEPAVVEITEAYMKAPVSNSGSVRSVDTGDIMNFLVEFERKVMVSLEDVVRWPITQPVVFWSGSFRCA
jgi:hypothetical protein